MKPYFVTPEPLKGSDPNSFAFSTITDRLPRMIDRIIKEENFSSRVRASLEKLRDDIPTSHIRQLTDFQAPDGAYWNAYLEKFWGKNWLQIPWFFAETYFYRRVLEATEYFIKSPFYHQDPFSEEKRRSLHHSWEEIQLMAESFIRGATNSGPTLEEFSSHIYRALWGNQADLSMWSSESGLQPKTESISGSNFVILDQCQSAHNYLASVPAGPQQIDIVLDNIGLELLGDLCLADYFLNSYQSVKIILHVKAHPTFVSDAIESDVFHMIQSLASDRLNPVRALGTRLQNYLTNSRIMLTTNWFWTSPLSGWEMPKALWGQLRKSDLVIWKGDANYRRLLGDRHWPYQTRLAEIIWYAPTAFLAIRTLKANVVCGLSYIQNRTLERQDPDWMINGKWGLIQFQSSKSSDSRGNS